MNVTTHATRILLREVNQKNFFLHKIVSFRPSAKHTDAAQAFHRRGTVTKYLVTVDGACAGRDCGRSQRLSDFCDFAAKNSNFNAIKAHFARFEAI